MTGWASRGQSEVLLGEDGQEAGLVGQLGGLLDLGTVHELCQLKLRSELCKGE